MADAKLTPDPKADPKTETPADAEAEEETFAQRQARVGGFPPPHVADEAPVSPYQDAVAELEDNDDEYSPAGQTLTDEQKAKASKAKASKETSKP